MKPNLIYKSILKVALCSLFVTSAAFAGEHGTAIQAEAMAHKAAEFVKANGLKKSVEEFTKGSAFKNLDLYVMYSDINGAMLGHGGNPRLIGKNLTNLKDPDGQLFYQKLLDVAKNKGKGWSDPYKFLNPVSNKIESKVTYIERVGSQWVGVGVYKD